VKAGEVVNEFGIGIVDVVRFKMSQGDEYRRRKDRILNKILTIQLPQTINHRLDLSQSLAFEPDFRDLELIGNQANCFYELQMLIFIQAIEIRKTIFIRLEEVSSLRLC